MLVRRGIRRAFTLVEMVVAVSILAIIALAIFLSATVATGGNASGGGGDNIDKAAHTLTDLAEAMALWTNRVSGTPTSFYQVIGGYPGTLSQLTTPITTNDRNSCGRGTPLNNATRYKTSEVNGWEGQFFRQELPPTGFLIAPGFFAQDSLLRYSAVMAPTPPHFSEEYFPTGNETTPGSLAIVMHNVAYADAVALARRVEGDTTGVYGAVRFTKNVTNAPVTVEFHIGIHGC